MRLSTAILAATVAVAAVTPALAAPRISDKQYIQAARCQGLAKAPALGEADTQALDSLVKSQGQGRHPYIRDRADEARQAAGSEARRAGPEGKAVLIAERDGVCKTIPTA